MQKYVGNKTAALLISYRHLVRNKRAGNRLNFIHNHSHSDLNIQGYNRSL